MGSGERRRRLVVLSALVLVLPVSGCAEAWQGVQRVDRAITDAAGVVSPEGLVTDLQDRARAHETVAFWLAGDVADGGGYVEVGTPNVKAELTVDGVEWSYLILDGRAFAKASDPWDAPWGDVDPTELDDVAELPLDPVRHLRTWADQAVRAHELEGSEEGGVSVRAFRLDLLPDGDGRSVFVDLVVDRTGLLMRSELWMDDALVQTTGYENWDSGVQLVPPQLADGGGRS